MTQIECVYSHMFSVLYFPRIFPPVEFYVRNDDLIFEKLAFSLKKFEKKEKNVDM